MKCARCGGEIPEGSPSCPGCGLKIKMRASGVGVPPPASPIPLTPADQAGDLNAEPPIDTGLPQPYYAPGEVTFGQPPPAVEQQSTKTREPIAILKVIIVVGVLAIVIAAAVYFLVLNQPWHTSGPQDVVLSFFKAMSSGDSKTTKSLFTPDSQSAEEAVNIISVFKKGVVKMEDPLFSIASQSGEEAVVKVTDFKLTYSVAGKVVSMNASQVPIEPTDPPHLPIAFELKQVKGKWLISNIAGPGQSSL